MVAPLTSMLKTIVLSEKSTFKRLEIGNSKINRFGIDGNVEYVKKSKKTSKSQNLAK